MANVISTPLLCGEIYWFYGSLAEVLMGDNLGFVILSLCKLHINTGQGYLVWDTPRGFRTCSHIWHKQKPHFICHNEEYRVAIDILFILVKIIKMLDNKGPLYEELKSSLVLDWHF